MPHLIRLPTQTWQELDGVQEPFSIRQFRGVSKLNPMSLDPAYAANLYNLSPANFPALSVRGGLTCVVHRYASARYESVDGRTGVLVEEGTQNLLGSYGILDTDSNGDGIADGWNPVATGSATGIRSMDSANATFGRSTCQRIERTGGASGDQFGISMSVTGVSTPNKISALVKVASLDPGAAVTLYADYFRSDNTWVQFRSVQLTAPTDWVWVELPASSDPTAARVNILIRIGGGNGVAYVQAVQSENKAYRTSFINGTRAAEMLTVPTAGVLSGLPSWTIEGWVLFTSLSFGSDGSLGHNVFWHMGMSGDGLGTEYEIHVGRNTSYKLFFYAPGAGFRESNYVVNDGQWCYIALVYDYGLYRFYADGQKLIEYTGSAIDYNQLGSVLRLNKPYQNYRYFNGLLGPLRISRRARTDQEIAAAYAAGTFRVDPDTTALFDFRNSVVGWSQKGAVYATFTRSSEAYNSNGVQHWNSNDSRLMGLGVHKDDVFLAFWGTKARWVKADGTTSGELMAGLTLAPWSFCNFQGNLSGIHLIAANGHSALKFNGSALSALANAPAGLNYVDTYANRVYGAVGSTLYFSALRKPEDWQTANDAGSIVVETPDGGNITGVKAGPNKLVVFKRYSMFELLGTGPENYSLVPVSDRIGCVSNNSIVTLDGVMRWLGADGIYEYTGGVAPRKDFSLPVQEYVDRVTKGYENRACAGTDGRRYYLALPIDGSPDPNIILEYDPQFQTWMVWYTTARVLSMAYRQGALYMGLEDGRIIKYDPSATTDDRGSIPWVWESPPIGSGSYITRKRWYDMWLVVDLPTGSTLDVYLSPKPEGEDSWTLVRSLTASSDMQSVRIILPVNTIANANWARVRLVGTGPCKVHELAYRDRVLPL